MIKKGFAHIGAFFLTLLSLLPLPVLFAFATFLYYPLYYVVGYRKKVVRENLRKSFPQKTKSERLTIEKTFFRYFLDLCMEILKMNSISAKEFNKRCVFLELDMIKAHLEQGRSIILCCGHYFNWEYGHFGLSLNGLIPAHVIYKPLNNKVFENWFSRLRSRYGSIMITMKQTLRAVVATRNETTIFCFASDQTPVKQEIQYSLKFLNQNTPVFLGMEKIAVQNNSPVFYFDMKRIKRGYYQVSTSIITLNPKETKQYEITNRFFELLENNINNNPPFWLWSHRRWKYAD